MAERLYFSALGPLEFRVGDRPDPHLAPMRRRLLAVLLSRAGTQVTVRELADAVWSGSPPPSASGTLQVHIHRLRQALGDPERIRREPLGYRITVAEDEFDVLRFNGLYERARAHRADGKPEAAIESLKLALELWRGEPYAGIEPSWHITAAVERLTEQRLIARLALYEASLDTGWHHDIVGPLTELADANPYVERASTLLMLALYRTGRQVDALEVYRERRAQMIDGLGVEPGSLMRRVHEAVLRSDDRLDDVATSSLEGNWAPVERPSVESAAAPADVPRELPRPPDRFTGRSAELRTLDGLLDAGPAPLAVVTGMGGIGKTALAVHWAHRFADRFPDGQLFIDLRGDDADTALRPIEALEALLSSLGLPAADIPFETDQAAARFRTHTGDKRMLIVLDNAAAAEQVRPLLPGGSDCMVLVTSRHRLADLTVRHGGTRFTLDPLDPADARDLIAELLDVPSTEAADLAELCGRLPLALRIAAADLADRPGTDVAAYSERLASGDRLSALQIDGSPDAAVRAVFESVYAAVPEEARRLFRLLGTAPGPDISAEGAARLADAAVEETERALDRLVAAHLVDHHRPGRYRLHDLLRLYAAERAEAEESAPERNAAVERLLEWYQRGADACRQLLYGSFARLQTEHGTEQFELDSTQAAEWLKAEYANLVVAVVHAAEHGPRRFAWLLNDALRGYMWLGARGHDALRTGRAALAAARAEMDLPGQAYSELSLTTAMLRSNRPDGAIERGRRAVELASKAGDLGCLAAAEQNVAIACHSLGRLDEAIVHGEAAMRANRKAGNPLTSDLAMLGDINFHLGEVEIGIEYFERVLKTVDTGKYAFKANVTAKLALGHLMLGDTDQAQSYMDEAFEATRREGGIEMTTALDAIAARVHLAGGRVQDAIEHANRAVDDLGDSSDRRLEAIALYSLALTLDARGDHREAVARYDRAIELTAEDVTYYRTLATLGRATAYLHLGETDLARRDAEAALETARECGYRPLEAQARDLLEAAARRLPVAFRAGANGRRTRWSTRDLGPRA